MNEIDLFYRIYILTKMAIKGEAKTIVKSPGTCRTDMNEK